MIVQSIRRAQQKIEAGATGHYANQFLVFGSSHFARTSTQLTPSALGGTVEAAHQPI